MKNQGKKPYQKNRSRTDNRNKSNSNKFKENKKKQVSKQRQFQGSTEERQNRVPRKTKI